jgi:hypothetical protein
MIEIRNTAPNVGLHEAVLFPFDDASLPFSAGLRLQLVSGKTPGKKNPIVLRRGEPGEPDDETVRYYGTIIQIGDELRMWYQARGTHDPKTSRQRRLCYAVSRDGVHWEKPKLGLVEYNGSTQNNIVDILGGRAALAATPIIHDPDDPDPARRFKTAFESEVYENRVAVAYSPDGLRWTESPRNPVAPMLEQAGLIRFRGCYYVNGQGGSHFGQGRKLVSFASYDFEHWTQSTCLGFRRDSIPPRQMATEWNAGEEVHLGAGLWDRGNVILGVYGMWHGHPTGDRNYLTMDLGLVVSTDALHYHEPIPDFKLIPSYEELDVALGTGPALMQGQGMANIGEQTLCWYESWRDGDVRLATWARDRLGYFEVFRASVGPHCLSCPIRIGGAAQLHANIDGLSDQSALTIEVCDEQFRPLPGYSGEACVPLQESGLRQPVRWRERDTIRGVDGPVRLQARFGGQRAEDVKLYALYLTDQ